jgi:hypothetical protein
MWRHVGRFLAGTHFLHAGTALHRLLPMLKVIDATVKPGPIIYQQSAKYITQVGVDRTCSSDVLAGGRRRHAASDNRGESRCALVCPESACLPTRRSGTPPAGNPAASGCI